jgi:Peptidase of plants and bacteria
MKNYLHIITTGIFLLVATETRAETKVTVDYHGGDDATAAFTFKTVPSPSPNDAATQAKFIIVDGKADANSGDVDKLQDGKLPTEADQPDENFFFEADGDGGRLQVDLGHAVNIKQVNTYSWHTDTRAPQIYKLYAADGTATNFNAAPKKEISPDQCGWKLIATVNTKPKTGDSGGQYGVSIANSDGNLGQYRYLLFDISPTEHDDAFGNTFYSEIDVIDADASATNQTAAEVAPFSFKTADGKCTIILDTKLAPELKDWAETNLAPVLAVWYPKITALLPSDGFTAPDHFKITLKPMPGVAYTAGRNVVANSDWLKKEIGKEAVGALVHECVHVVQQFNGSRNPGWLVEGSADYVRWFIYEPQSHGADIVWMKRQRKSFSPNYNDSYRTTADFLDWVSGKYDKDLVTQLNAAMRDNAYSADFWKQYTGKTAPELGEEWKTEVMAQLAGNVDPTKPN